MTKQQLFEQVKKKQSFLCVGLDTDIKKIPGHLLETEDPIYEFNKAIIDVLERESLKSEAGIFWTFYVPFFSQIAQSGYYDTFCRYVSVSYYPESLEWWQQNPDAAVNFVMWFEKGDDT